EDYDKAEEYALRAKKIAEDLGETVYVILSDRQLGIIDWHKKRYKEAEEKFEKVLNYFISAGNKSGEAQMQRWLGKVYMDTNRFREAESMFLKGLKFRRETADSINIMLITHDLGELYFMENNFKASDKSYKEALSISGKIGFI